MQRITRVLIVGLLTASVVVAGEPAGKKTETPNMPFGDFSWMHGVNYTPSYAATDVEFWLKYDHDTIDRELGYAERIGLNCVRVFLQSLVYEHDPDTFLSNFEDLLATADRHGLKVMPILFDSCFGVAPSLESNLMWVANPGPDRMDAEHYAALDAFAKAVVAAHVGDRRIALWDVMNEPGVTVLALTEQGRAQIWSFVHHYGRLVKQLDESHAITVGIASADNAAVMDLVDVLSCHSYAPTRELFRKNLARTQSQARAVGKPWIISECCAPGWGNHYEMVFPELRAFGVGHTVWELIIGRDQFAPISGLFYPDGSVRRVSQIEAVTNAPATGLVEKPDSEGIPIAAQRAGRLAEYVRFTARNAVTDATWRERNTLVAALAVRKIAAGQEGNGRLQTLDAARQAYAAGDKSKAFREVEKMLKQAARTLTDQDTRGARPKPRPQNATIYRDVYGVPHIFADTEAAGMYALAFAQCQDNARQVFQNLRIGAGRAAEVVGENGLDRDRDVHLWRIGQIAEDAWKHSDLRTRRMIQAYCDGLNAYRKDFPDQCPDALEATPTQVLAWAEYFMLSPGFGIHKIDIQTTLKGAKPPEFPTGQSSTFVIGGSRSASGRPMVLIDPHWPAEGSISFLEFHLHAGRLDVGGFAVPGMPFAGLGYTPGVAWGMTAGGADSADVFELAVDPDHPDQYWFDAKWRPMTVRNVRLSYKTDGGQQQRTFKLRETVHGPVVYDQDGRVFAAAICGWKKSHLHEQFYAMNLAKNKREFMAALRKDELFWLNCCYATANGDIGYYQLGSAPIRPERPGEFLALDGTRSSAMWTGTVALDDLPQVHNPDTDWLQSCNTCAPDTTTGLTMKRTDFPPGTLFAHLPDENGNIWRGRRDRCFQVLPQLHRATLHDAESLALDTLCPAGPLWAPALVKAYDERAAQTPDPTRDLKLAADAVRTWDYRTNKDRIGQTVFLFWREEYAKLRPHSVGEMQASGFPKSEAEKADAVQALQQAVKRMKKLYGTVEVPWGRVLRIRKDGLDLPLDGGGGGSWSVHSESMRSVAARPINEKGQCIFSGGQVVTTVVELTDPVRVRSIVPYGQSHEPGNRHATDQMRLYSEGRLRPAWHDWSQLVDHIESHASLTYVPSRFVR